MKRFLATVLLLPMVVWSYEICLPNLRVPTQLEQNDLELTIHHRFAGKVDTLGTWCGLLSGVKANVGARYVPWSTLELNAAFYTDLREVEAGASYALLFPRQYFKLDLEAEWYNYQDPDNQRKNSWYLGTAMQSYPLWTFLCPAVNFGYDFLKQKPGLGLGLDIILLEWIDVFGEYCPIISPSQDSTSTITKNSFSFGFKITTAAHHFLFFLQNTVYDDMTSSMGGRHVMFGTDNNDLHFGFCIQRMISFR